LLLRFNLGSEWNDIFVESDLTWNLKLTANAPIGVKVSRKAVWFVEHEELWSSGINHHLALQKKEFNNDNDND
jgi:hypothetical protein